MSGSCVDFIEKKFASKRPQTYIVDVHTPAEMNEILTHFSVGDITIVHSSNYCKDDELPRLDNLYNDVASMKKATLVCELSSFVRFNGEEEMRTQISNILGLQVSGSVIFLTFCCSEMLSFSDPRIKDRIYISEEKKSEIPEIIFVGNGLPLPANVVSHNGINTVAALIERQQHDSIYVVSNKNKKSYRSSMYSITDLSCAYDILCQKENSTRSFDSSLGTEKNWSSVLALFESNDCWEEAVSSVFGNYKNLEYVIPNYEDLSDQDKWFYFFALKMFGAGNNDYLNMVVSSADDSSSFIRQIFRELLSVDHLDKRFSKLYSERKRIIKYFKNYSEEFEDYCKVARSKTNAEIFYLTDISQLEKEEIIRCLDKYGLDWDVNELSSILANVYPDLNDYLSQYHFNNNLLDDYFQQYKYQKIVNKVLPEFIEKVEEQSEKREYALLLEPRSAKFDAIDKEDSQLYFMDAMGVEYLGFILAKCYQKGLEARVNVCYSELPSLTCFNKEFVNIYEELGLPVISIKDIDEIKHHGKFDYDYSQTHLPIHLVKELSIIDDTLDRIRIKLIKNECSKVIMVSDHGASRLAVIFDSENQWEMSVKGIHSGRCCPKSDLEDKPECSTEENNYWVLANYDRFKGGRKANVEVHGGAALEEVVVPIIELSIKQTDIEINIVETVIYVSFRKKASLKLFSKTKLNSVSVKVNGNFYEAVPTDDNFYVVEMPDIKKKGEYSADVYSEGNLIVSGLNFIVEKEGTKENKLF